MTPFEEELKKAMQRQEPASDFTARVLVSVAHAEAKNKLGLWPMWRFGLASAVVALLVMGGGTAYQQHERAVRGMEAKRQLLLAMHIAGDKLQQAQERVKESEQVTQ